jgi:hypothetical protein
VVIEDDWIELADAIRVVREQLDIAREAGESEGTRFEVSSVEIELAVQVTKDGNVKGGVRLGVVSFDAGGGVSSASTHRVKLALSPSRDGEPLEINREIAKLPPRHPGPATQRP